MPQTQNNHQTINTIDRDGVPPGLDLTLNGKRGYVKFSGFFFAQPDVPYQEFKRPVLIIFASKGIFVALDLVRRNIYVVDRETNISLGCQMTAHFEEGA